jgi:hypothetical protein
VAEHGLDVAQAAAVLQQVGGEGVAEHMAKDSAAVAGWRSKPVFLPSAG